MYLYDIIIIKKIGELSCYLRNGGKPYNNSLIIVISELSKIKKKNN